MTALHHHLIRLHPEDDVAIARLRIPAGTPVDGTGARTLTDIPAAHKVALRPLAPGQPVYKYGHVIGYARRAIAAGEHVHDHNLGFGEVLQKETAARRDRAVLPEPPPDLPRHFLGFVREDGRVGTRNYLGVIATVNCAASACRLIREGFPEELLRDHPTVDGIVAITHGTGCGMALDGEGFACLQRTLLGFLRHPNFAGVLLVGLGCETNQIRFLLEAQGMEPGPRLQTLTLQECGGTRRTVERGIAILRDMIVEAGRARRVEVAAGELVLALQCGGSDGYSGITANPALGHAADLLVALGGTAILAETPEIYGAEHLLLERAVSEEVGAKLLGRIRWWEDYVARHGGSMDNNPTPGNKAGGLTTILEKSLGAVAKGGRAPLADVLLYAEPARARGLLFMDSPGYDPCSVTGQVASGANLIAFTTGRGSCFGFKPVPSLKLASHSGVFRRMRDDMDINCGTLLDGEEDLESLGRRIYRRLIALASGEPSCSERLGIGECEFVPWQLGAVM